MKFIVNGIGLLILGAALGTHACGLRDGGATLLDPGTKLEIQKCPIKTAWNGSGCWGKAHEFSFVDAVRQYGQGVWRLMTLEEAEKVLQRGRGCPIVGYPWTSTPNPRNEGAWNVNFSDAILSPNNYSYGTTEVILVRLNQSWDAGSGLLDIPKPLAVVHVAADGMNFTIF